MRQIFILLLIATSLFALNKKVKNGKIYIEYPWCYISGHNLTKTYKTNYIAILDNETRAYSSIRYLAKDYDNIENKIKEILVIDAKTNKAIDAKSAYYVVNSKAKGSYSQYSKIAFEKKSDAKEFVKRYKGDIREFGFTLYLATRDLAEDSIKSEKKDKKIYFRGEKIYKRVCKNLDINITKSSIYEYMKYIKESKSCNNLKDKDIRAVAFFIQNKNRYKKVKIETIDVPKDAKCPVCGMFVYKYPKWTALAVSKEHSHYFDGNKDFFKFVFEPKRFGHDEVMSELYVTDYYTLKKIDAKKAYYVVGSNVLGPMGHELISFEKLKDAKVFKREHLGKAIYEYKEIKKELVYRLD
jgi:nitrous oxide reductase accessory protein NosL